MSSAEYIHARRTKARKWIRRKFGLTCNRCETEPERLVLFDASTDHYVRIGVIANWSRSRIEEELATYRPLCWTCYRDRHFIPSKGDLHCIEGRKTYMHRTGYVMVYYPNHSHAWKGSGCVLLHRLVMENHLGRILDPSEVVHHKDEDKTNNVLSNLEVLLSNSDHTLQHRPRTTYVCDTCGTTFESKKKKHTNVYCSKECSRLGSRKANRPTKEELVDLVWKHPTSRLAEHFGVSDNAVAKWCKKYGINKPPRGYWQKKRVGLIS